MRDAGSLTPRPARIPLLPALQCAALGLLANELEHVPQYFIDPPLARAYNLADPTLHGNLLRLAGEAAIVLLTVAFVRAAARHRPGLAAEPGRFIAAVLLGASIGFLLVRGAGSLLAPGLIDPRPRFIGRDWLALMVWCALFGWLFFLTLRRRDDRARLSWMLMRRVLLRRQLAQSRLGAARAQIDPRMIAGVLRTARAHAAGLAAPGGPAPDPVTLIDHLALHLRLLLDRVRRGTPTVRSDIALVQSLMALRSAETGITLHLQLDPGVEAAGPRPAMATFPVVRAMLDAALEGAPARVDLALQATDTALRVRMRFAGPDMSAGVRARLAATLVGLQPGAGGGDHRFDSGMNCHDVDVPLH